MAGVEVRIRGDVGIQVAVPLGIAHGVLMLGRSGGAAPRGRFGGLVHRSTSLGRPGDVTRRASGNSESESASS